MRLVYYPDPFLKKVMPEVPEVTDAIRETAEAMVPFMKLENGIGLAAPQVGWSARVLVASEDGSEENSHVLINPKVVWKSKATDWDEEGCLSLPGVYGEVLRHESVKVHALDIDGKDVELEAHDLFARVIQHEIDHLDGVLFISRMRPGDKVQNKKKILELMDRTDRVPAPDADLPHAG